METFLARFALAAVFAALIGAVGAAESKDDVPVPPPPPDRAGSPGASNSGPIEPEVTITTQGSEIHEEYRYNGVLYMVKIIPAHGPPYYLVYDDRGRARRSDLEPDIIVPQWVIKRF